MRIIRGVLWVVLGIFTMFYGVRYGIIEQRLQGGRRFIFDELRGATAVLGGVFFAAIGAYLSYTGVRYLRGIDDEG
jgi:hypothetical protein